MIGRRKNISLDEPDQPTLEDVPFLRWRLLTLFMVLVFAFGSIAARFYYLMVLRGPYFYELSEDNFLFEREFSAPRGSILTSDGSVVAQNEVIYNISMSPFRMDDEMIVSSVDRTAELLKRPELRDRSQEVLDIYPPWAQVALARNLDPESAAPVLERLYEIPGIIVEPGYRRRYPYGRLMGHLTGYVGVISERDIQSGRAEGYLPDDPIGKDGAERAFEQFLPGVAGKEIYIRDAVGRPRSAHVERPARGGHNVTLTIDMKLQELANRLMADYQGAVVALDPRTGAILALLAKPDYDANDPLGRQTSGKVSSYNRATRGQYAPASTFKLITATAGLMAGFDPDAKVSCNGSYYLKGVRRPFWCDIRSGHGALNTYEAIQKSCNVFFYTWADRLGYNQLMAAAEVYGFGAPTGIENQPEGAGILRRPGVGKPIYMGSVLQMAIGQGELISATPLQIANAYAAIANGGIRHRPHLLKEVRSVSGAIVHEQEGEIIGRVAFSDEQHQVLIEGLRRVIQVKGGTAFRVGFDPAWDAAGKTGSAEVHRQKLTNGLFVAFAPITQPEICILAVVEAEGHGGSTAAPIVNELMADYFRRHPRAIAEPVISSLPANEGF